jgi:hypothetical protein
VAGHTPWKEIKRKRLSKRIKEENPMDVEEVKRIAKQFEVLERARENAAAKEEVMSPAYHTSYHRRMTPEEIAEIDRRVRLDQAEKICHPTPTSKTPEEIKAKLAHVTLSNCEPMTATKVRESFKHGPVGGESTPPFGCHEDSVGVWGGAPEVTKDEIIEGHEATIAYWKRIAEDLKEEISRLDGCIDDWRGREEYLMAQAHELRVALADAERDVHELRNPLDILKADRPLTKEELDGAMEVIELDADVVDTLCQMSLKTLLDDVAKPLLTDYPLRKDPVDRLAEEFGKAKAEALDREIMAQQAKRREKLAKEGTPECHGDGEVYGRGPALEGERVTYGFSDEEDLINSPSHYNQFGLECIDAIKLAVGEEGFVGYCHGNALKYLWRAEYKHSKRQDLAKAAWYCRMATGDDPRDE